MKIAQLTLAVELIEKNTLKILNLLWTWAQNR